VVLTDGISIENTEQTDRFKLGRRGYLNGACPSYRYPTATGWGAFKEITVGDNTQSFANTDYYAYLLGQQTFSNPEAVNINVFVTPGIDYVNNSNLVEDAEAIEMIEFTTELTHCIFVQHLTTIVFTQQVVKD
jgi:hypothetical protein